MPSLPAETFNRLLEKRSGESVRLGSQLVTNIGMTGTPQAKPHNCTYPFAAINLPVRSDYHT
jgi:hypothetical protein